VANDNDHEFEHPFIRREKTLAVVLGASEWPEYPEFDAKTSFRLSANDIVEYIRGPSGLNLPRRNVKVLFDSFDDAPDILRQIRQFIGERRQEANTIDDPITDLFVYYIGHGGITADSNTFFLAIRSTSQIDPIATSITAESIGVLVRDGAAGLRTYIVLDCCFAASLAKVFMTSGPLVLAGVQLRDKLPPQGDSDAVKEGKWPNFGIGILCASGSREPAKAPPDLPYTMFTGGLLDVLRTGDFSEQNWLSLDAVQRLVRDRLRVEFSDKAVLPEVYAPQQRWGRVDLVPLFPNPARQRASLFQKEATQAAETKRKEEQAAQAAEVKRREKQADQAAEAKRKKEEAAEAAEVKRKKEEATQAAEAKRKEQQAAEAAEVKRKEEEARSLKKKADMRAAIIKAFCRIYVPTINPIPPYKISIQSNKLQNAYSYLGVPPSQEILALVDTTFTKSNKTGIAFTIDGMYFRNMNAEPEYIVWSELCGHVDLSKEGGSMRSLFLIGKRIDTLFSETHAQVIQDALWEITHYYEKENM
jgi:hypothetical protein